MDHAWRIAIGDLAGNIQPFRDGLLESPVPCLLAGLDYDTPWTRDAAINVWNGAVFASPEVARNTLLSVLEKGEDGVRIGGQYWDAIIWATGAWHHYLATGDREFLALAGEASRNALIRFEQTEFDPAAGLFRGAACFQDGVAAYPDIYVRNHGTSGILAWPDANPELRHPAGVGLPMFACSTNCLYVNAYRLMTRMERALGRPPDPQWERKAAALRAALVARFWDAAGGTLRYLVDPFGGCDYQEGLGYAFALLFDILDAPQAKRLLAGVSLTPHGIACVWPSFDRYVNHEAPGGSFGRHSGTIWPQVNAFWAEAALTHGRADVFEAELFSLARKAVRDAQFAEIYHPGTGLIYGGRQEGMTASEGIIEWVSCRRQTWCATGFMRMVLYGLLGMRLSEEGLSLAPHLPHGVERVAVHGLRYGQGTLDLMVTRGDRPSASKLLPWLAPAEHATLTACF